MTTYVQSEFNQPVGGNTPPVAPYEFGVQGDCAAELTSPGSPFGGTKFARVNRAATVGTAYPGPGLVMDHFGIIVDYPLPGSRGACGFATKIPAVTLDNIPIAPADPAFTELFQFSLTDGTVAAREFTLRVYRDRKLGIGVFQQNNVHLKSTWTITPDQWFYTVMEGSYGSAATLTLYIYDSAGTLVETLSGVYDTRGTKIKTKHKLGGETNIGLWPDQYNTYHDSWYIADSNLGIVAEGFEPPEHPPLVELYEVYDVELQNMKWSFDDYTNYGTILENVRLARAPIERVTLKNFYRPGEALASWAYRLRDLEITFALGGISVDHFQDRQDALAGVLSKKAGLVKFRLPGAGLGRERVYEYMVPELPEYLDGRREIPFWLTGQKLIPGLTLTLPCQPIPVGRLVPV
jgi:hypothetical protein